MTEMPWPLEEVGGEGELPAIGEGRRRWTWDSVLSLPHVLTVVFLAVCGTFIFRHALWIDEAQAFNIARDSRSLGELFWNMRYEGHPPLWHFLLWIVTRFTPSIAAMQMLHLLLAAGSVYLVTRFAPFPVLAKILFPFGYFTLFEYGVIARNYQLIMLLSFAFCAVWQAQGRWRRAWLGLILALLALSHAMGAIIAGGLGVMLLVESLTNAGRREIRQRPLAFVIGAVLAIGGAAATAYLLKPPADYGYARVAIPKETVVNGQVRITGRQEADWYWHWDETQFQNAMTTLYDGLLPIPKWQVHFWDSAMIDRTPAAARLGEVLAVAALVFMSRSWRAMTAFVIGAGGLVAFSYFKFRGGVRHDGGLFIVLLAALWIAWRALPGHSPVALRALHWAPRRALVVLLAVHAYSATVACYYAWQVPFSSGRAAAQAIEKAMKPGDLLVADMEFITPVIAAYLPGHTFHIMTNGYDRNFIVWLHGRPDSSGAGFAAGRNYARVVKKPIIWVSRAGMGGQTMPGVTFIGEFTGGGATLQDAQAIMPMETYSVYRIEP